MVQKVIGYKNKYGSFFEDAETAERAEKSMDHRIERELMDAKMDTILRCQNGSLVRHLIEHPQHCEYLQWILDRVDNHRQKQ